MIWLFIVVSYVLVGLATAVGYLRTWLGSHEVVTGCHTCSRDRRYYGLKPYKQACLEFDHQPVVERRAHPRTMDLTGNATLHGLFWPFTAPALVLYTLVPPTAAERATARAERVAELERETARLQRELEAGQ